MDVRLLINETNSTALTLISSRLYSIRYNYIVDNDCILIFHDEERSDLFYIYLNEFLNTEFVSPLNRNKKVSIFQLLIDYCYLFPNNDSFKTFLNSALITKDFFFRKRFYKYYISPHVIDFEISFAELINFQSNYSKHSFYHLDCLKNKLKNIFKQNGIINYEAEDYNCHLDYFKEAVLDDRLEFNQTHFIIVLGDFFLAFWDLINSVDNQRIRIAIKDFVEKNGRLAKWNIVKPDNLTDVEQFHWEIKGINFFDRYRLEKFLPNKGHKYPIEEVTSKTNMIEKHTMEIK